MNYLRILSPNVGIITIVSRRPAIVVTERPANTIPAKMCLGRGRLDGNRRILLMKSRILELDKKQKPGIGSLASPQKCMVLETGHWR